MNLPCSFHTHLSLLCILKRPQTLNANVSCVSAAYIQTTRALMITGSILGFLAVVMLLMSMPCINLGNEAQGSKNRRAILGGVLVLIVGKNRSTRSL